MDYDNIDQTITRLFDSLQICAGALFLLLIFIPMFYMLVKDLLVFCISETKKYWIWDTISLSLSKGNQLLYFRLHMQLLLTLFDYD